MAKGNLRKSYERLTQRETWKKSGLITVGAVLNPIVSGGLSAVGNMIRPGLIPSTGLMAKGIDLLSSVVTFAVAASVSKDPQIPEYVMYGAVAGAVNDLATEGMKKAGLGAYLTVDQVRSAKKKGTGAYLTTDSLKKAPRIGAYATEQGIKDAKRTGTRNERF